jgi:hypothetical protein
MTGGVGREALRESYSRLFIPKMPADIDIVPVSRTIGTDRLVDEMIFRFTRTVEMEWMLPGVPPTGRRVEIPLVVVIHFRDGKLAHEHISTGTRLPSWSSSGCAQLTCQGRHPIVWSKAALTAFGLAHNAQLVYCGAFDVPSECRSRWSHAAGGHHEAPHCYRSLSALPSLPAPRVPIPSPTGNRPRSRSCGLRVSPRGSSSPLSAGVADVHVCSTRGDRLWVVLGGRFNRSIFSAAQKGPDSADPRARESHAVYSFGAGRPGRAPKPGRSGCSSSSGSTTSAPACRRSG